MICNVSRLFYGEQAIEFGINPVGNRLEILWIILEISVVSVYNDEITFIVFNSILIAVVQSCEVIDADTLFEFAPTFTDVVHQSRYA